MIMLSSTNDSILGAINKVIVKFMDTVVIITSVAIPLMICATVVMRYIFHTDLYSIDEFETLLAFWLYFIGAAYASYSKKQITADIVVQFCKNRKFVKYVQCFTSIISFLISCIFTKFSIDLLIFAIERGQKTLAWRIPMSFTYMAITLGFILMAIYSLRDAVITYKS